MLRQSLCLVAQVPRLSTRLVSSHSSHLDLNELLSARLFSSHSIHLDSNEFTSALYSRLGTKEQYQFLDPSTPPSSLAQQDQKLAQSKAFQQLLGVVRDGGQGEEHTAKEVEMEGLQKQLCESFTQWSQQSQLSVGFLMYLDKRIQADDYLSKVIKHLSSGNLFDLGAQDLTALLLLIYFKKDLTLEDVVEWMDPELLLHSLASKMGAGALNRDEICACCLGLKKLAGLTVNNPPLRKQLYLALQGFMPSSPPSKMDDFFVVTLMTTLAKGNLIFKDDLEEVKLTMHSLKMSVNQLKLDTAIKVMNFPMTRGFRNSEVESCVLGRLKTSESSELTIRDLCQVCNYLSKSPHQEATNHLQALVPELERHVAGLASLQELGDMVESHYYLSHKGVYSESFTSALFSALAAVPGDITTDFRVEKKGSQSQARVRSQAIAGGLASNLGMCLDEGWEAALRGGKLAAVFSRIPAFICSSYQLEKGEAVESIRPSLLFSLSSHYHKTLPIQLYSPMMDMKKLDLRMKQLITCYRSAAKFLGGEEYCRVVRLLPHYDEPDLVFGNIGGNSLTVPASLWEGGALGPRRAPPGDWHVLVIGTRKSIDLDKKVVGQEAAKLKQLEMLGYNTCILPYSDLSSPAAISRSITRVLKTQDVYFPAAPDGWSDKNHFNFGKQRRSQDVWTSMAGPDLRFLACLALFSIGVDKIRYEFMRLGVRQELRVQDYRSRGLGHPSLLPASHRLLVYTTLGIF